MIQTEQTAEYRKLALDELRKYREYMRAAQTMLKLKETALERVERVSKSFDEICVQHQPNPKSGEAALAQAIDHKQELQEKVMRLEQKCMDIEHKIMELDRREEQVILLRVFVFNQTVEIAAEEMFCSRRTGWRMYNKAILNFGKKLADVGTN